MERRIGLHDPVKAKGEHVCVDSTRKTCVPEMSAVSSSCIDEAAVVRHKAERIKSLESLQASEFVCMIKDHFPNDCQVLKNFLDILESYSSEKKSVQVLYREAANLFNGHEVLLAVLPHFMPDQGQTSHG